MKNLQPFVVCPFHEGEAHALLMKDKIDINHKGTNHNIDCYFYFCGSCGEEFTTNECDAESLKQIPGSIWSK